MTNQPLIRGTIMAESEFDRKIGKIFETIFGTSKKSKNTKDNNRQRQTQIVLILIFGFMTFVALQLLGEVSLLIIPIGVLFYKYLASSGGANTQSLRENTEDEKYHQSSIMDDETRLKDDDIDFTHNDDDMHKDDPSLIKADYDPISQSIYGDPFDDSKK
ncbi:MAG: hypothetical protein AAF849_18305 [Bacteroidota bacterium]